MTLGLIFPTLEKSGMSRSVSIILMCGLTLWALLPRSVQADDGYDLWLRYHTINDQAALDQYRSIIQGFNVQGDTPTLEATRKELTRAFGDLLDVDIPSESPVTGRGVMVLGTLRTSSYLAEMDLSEEASQLGEEGFLIRTIEVGGYKKLIVLANSNIGVLYGAFHLLHLLQTHQDISDLNILESPKIQHRILNHWDNLDRTVERGYAGFSIWDWHRLPDYLDPRYTDYARANASIGINGTVLTNVNANATSLTEPYLRKFAAIANVLRPYGIKVYLTARFSAPIEIGGLETADPLNEEVAQWWKDKTDEIYTHIPDFGGFLVKANSEGQPGPQDYNRSHAEGANMLADAVASHGGIVMWRAFVYSNEEPEDRAKQAYNEFVPLDGTFRDNVLIQVKNGPIDFQPREPFHPLFGAMPQTPLMMEFQITKEYLGQGTHLVYLAPMYKEVLNADTYAQGSGSRVSSIIDGSLHGYEQTGIAGVSNIGTDRNWCGSLFDCANWYAFGKLAWNPGTSSRSIADQWVRMTFTNDPAFIEPVVDMMLSSWQACINYMTPLGLHHLMGRGHHYGPGPWVKGGPRADWTSVYYHRADSIGVGFDRSATGSHAVDQYFPPLNEIYGSAERIPEKYLLWFHRIEWDYTMRSGRSLWDELAHRYQAGVDAVRAMQATWLSVKGMIDQERYQQVEAFLSIQEKEAKWWRDSSLLYFQTFSGMEIPEDIEQPTQSLEYFINLSFPYAPGHY